MSHVSRLCLAATLVALVALIFGCTTVDKRESSIPWSRPAGWENQIPGMSSPNSR